MEKGGGVRGVGGGEQDKWDGLHGREGWRFSPCLSGSAQRDTRALTAGKVILDMAATAPAAHIILSIRDT